MNPAYGHIPGQTLSCESLRIYLVKEPVIIDSGKEIFRVGFKIGGGIDQDRTQAPFNYPDSGIYVTKVEPGSPADQAGLRQHDKILEVNKVDFTMLTHSKAVKYIQKDNVIDMRVVRLDMIPTSIACQPFI